MTNAARRPNASRANTYFPPACGCRVDSSAKISAPRKPPAPPRVHATKVRPGRPRSAATVPGVRKMPEPTMIPTTTASPSIVRRLRASLTTWSLVFRASPGIDEAPPDLAFRPRRVQPAQDPVARLRWIDDGVELEERGHIERRAAPVRLRDERLRHLLAGGGILDRLELPAHPDADRALEIHSTELSGGPGDVEKRRMEMA